jgi:hypothetical protein
VIDEHLNDPLKVLLVQNQEPVETLRTGRAHKPLGNHVGLWRAKRCLNDLNSIASEDLIKLLGELLIPIPNQKPYRFRPVR